MQANPTVAVTSINLPPTGKSSAGNTMPEPSQNSMPTTHVLNTSQSVKKMTPVYKFATSGKTTLKSSESLILIKSVKMPYTGSTSKLISPKNCENN